MTKVRINIENDRVLPAKKFPVEIFPPEILEIIRAYVDSLNVNIDYACATFLVAFAAAMGSKYCIKVKRGWVEFASIFLSLVGRAGLNKSGPLSQFTSPLEKIDFELFDIYRVQLKEFKKRMRVDEKGKNLEDPPIRRQVVIKDATQEALLLALFQNPHGLIGIFDELMSFGKSINKYRPGGGDEEFYLSTFSSKPYSINRKQSEPILIERPVLNLIGGIQPLVLGKMFDGNRNSNGFTHRFLFVYPDKVVREDLSDTEISPETEANLEAVFRRMIGDLSNFNLNPSEPLIISFSDGAMCVYKGVRASINQIINEGSDDNISGIFSKLEIYYIRFCLILHVLSETLSSKIEVATLISEKTAEEAKKLYDYFSLMALKVHGEISVANDPLTRIPLRFRDAMVKLPGEFSTGEAWSIFSMVTTSKKTMYNYLSQSDLFTRVDVGKYRREY